MKITVKRTHLDREGIKGIVFSDFDGVLYEYNGFQFCIGTISGVWRAIELQTGYSAANYDPELTDSVDHCIREIIFALGRASLERYKEAIGITKMSLESSGFTIPINEKIIVDENKD